MWRRRGSIGGGSTSSSTTAKSLESPGQSNSLTGYPSTPGGGSLYGDPRAEKNDRPFIFTIDVPTPGPLGLDLRARHIERDKPQRGCIVKGFRPLDGGRRGYVEETARVKVGDILQVIHKTQIDELPFEQIVNHAILLQKDPSAWPLRLEFKREASTGGDKDGGATGRPRRSSFFRSSIINPAQDGNFNEKLQYFRGFFANRMPTGGAAPKIKEKPKMPSSDTVNEMYRDLLLKRGVPDDVMDELIRIESLDTKWHVVWYAQQHENEEHTQSSSAEAAKLAESLVELKWDNRGLKELEALRNKISVGSTEWLEAFLANFGLDYLTMKLPDPSPFPIEHHKYEKATRVCEVILRILRSLTHFSAGVEAITNVPGLVKRIALCFHTDNGDLKKYTLQLLGIVCYNSAAGHQAVIQAFDHYKNTKGESVRFSCLRDALKSARYSLVFKEDVLSFVNIIVNKAIRLEDRLAIRSDFIALNMAGYFEEIRAKSLAVQRKKYPLTTDASPEPTPTPSVPAQMSTGVRGKVNSIPSPVLRSDTSPPIGRPFKLERKHSVGTGKSPVLRPLSKAFMTSKSAPSSPVDRSDSMTASPTQTVNRTSLPLDRDGDGKYMGGTIISSTVTQLRNQLDNVEKQIDVFERFMEEDRKDTIYEKTDLSSIESVFKTLMANVAHDTELNACLLSVLQQLLFIPADRVIGKEMWALCERLMKQVGLLAPVEEVKNFELGYEDRKALLKMRDRYTEFLQKCSDDDPTFEYHIGPVILIKNREQADDLSDTTADETDEEDVAEQLTAQEHPDLIKYFKLLKMGMPIQHVQLKMQSEVTDFDVSILETPDKIIQMSKPGEEEKQGIRAEEHEKYAKFFKLKKMGMPMPHIQLKMSAEGLDGAILETPDLLLDDEGNEFKAESPAFSGISVKDHEKFAKFFKLLKMGMPAEHIKLKVSSEGLDPNLLDNPDQLLNEDGTIFVPGKQETTGIPVKEHDKFAKFFKLMKMGMPIDHIKLKASAEGLNANLLDTPDAMLNEDGTPFTGGESAAPKGTPVKEHETFAKFFKLLKMGMPIDHVKLKASAEGLDANLLDTPDKLVDDDGKEVVAGAEAEGSKGTPVKEHEKFAKYFKLLKMGMPMEHVKLKVSADGLDANLLETPDKLLDEAGNEIKEPVKGIPVKEHEKYAKFFKLLKMGMPMPHIQLKAKAEGLDANLLETPDVLVDEEGEVIKAETKLIKACEHPSYAKYYKLLKMGMPRPQLELKMKAEGLDTKLLDTPDTMISDGDPSDTASNEPAKPALPPPPPKPKLRNLYWDVVKTEITSGTIWEKFAEEDAQPAASGAGGDLKNLFRKHAAAIGRDAVMEKYMNQLPDIFVNKPPKAKESEDAKKTNAKRRAPTRVALIDVKRANNIGIMLARFRLPYWKIRNAVLLVDKEMLSLEKVSALIQFAPEDEELAAVKAYNGNPKLLGDAEQYFQEMLCVPRLPTRLQAIHATWQFDTYVEEQTKLMESVSSACRELEECGPLKQIFKVVLQLGNALNDGTARGGAKGFRLNILLKLNQVKASDNSITLLNYVAQILRAKDPVILEFDKLLPSLESASRVTVQVLRAGESAVRKAASLIVDELEAHAKLPPAEFPSPPHLDGEEPVIITDRFQEEVKPFADRAQKISDDIVEQLDQTMKSFEDTASFYGEDPASPECGPDSFFSIFYSFGKLLQSADRDNERKRIAEERRIRRDEEAKKRLEMLKKKKQASSFASLKTGDVDDIVSKIRAKRVAEKRAEMMEKPFESSSNDLSGSIGPTSPVASSLSSSNGPSSRAQPPHRQLSSEKAAIEVV